MELRILNNETRIPAPPRPAPTWLALGFRPFFLAASWYAVLSVAVWIAGFLGWIALPLGGMLWHAHEMLFGFVVAAVAGFLLTAVPNWTGQPTPRGTALGGLLGLWLLGRLAGFLPWPVLAAALDLSFLPALALSLATPLLKGRKWTNLVFLPILAWLSLANAMIWAQALGWSATSAALGLELGLLGVLTLVVVIGGRVIPFFTRAALPESPARSWPWLERLAVGSMLAILLAEVAGAAPSVRAGLSAAAAGIHTLRWWGWHDRRLWRVPLLRVLFAGYAWLCFGLALRAWALATGGSPFPALHALTVGCIGGLVLGMMARVALGHTGRSLQPSPWISRAFWLIGASALVRVLGPLFHPALATAWIALSGVLWMLSYGLYALIYLPILTRPRVDGKPG